MHSTGVVPQRLAQPIALGGLLFFVDSLLYFAYRYVVVFGRETPRTTDVLAIAVNVTLFTLFALHHSVFARDIVRKRITRIVGALERSTYVWISSALFIVVCAWWQPVGGLAWRIDRPALVWLLRAAQLFGVWLTLRSAWLIDFFALAGMRQVGRVQRDLLSTTDGGQLDSGGRAPSGPATEFTTRGPYSWVRHPIYTGWFLFVFAEPLMTMTRFVFAATSSLYLVIAIPFEERSLRRASSGAYDRYVRHVRWKLVPHLY